MKHARLIFLLMMLGSGLLQPIVGAGAANPTPTPVETYVLCKVCGEEEPTPTLRPEPVAHFWFFFDGRCYGCRQVYNSILPRILAQYEPGQVAMHAWDVSQFGDAVQRAMEQQYGIANGDATEVFIGEYALLGSHTIETQLPQLIDQYLAAGGVPLVQLNVVAQPIATRTPTLAPSLNPTASAQTPVVRAVLFWSNACPQCRAVIEQILPSLQKKYGNRFDLRMFELSDPAYLELFEAALEALRVPPNQWGVPFMIVGDQIMVGSIEIPERLQGLIEKYLAVGGIGWPPIPGLEKFVGAPTPTAMRLATPVTATPTPAVRLVVNDTPMPPTPAPTTIVQAPAKPVVRAVMFWMNGCPHCEEIINRVLPPLQRQYGEQLDVQLIEVVTTQDVDQLYQITANFNVPKERTGVPFLVIGNQALTANQIPTELPHLIEKYLAAGGVDAPNLSVVPAKERHLLDLPFVGQIDLDQHSLAFNTIIIGLMDGFNPCSLWVISLLLALVVNTGSRKKTLLVGLTFLLVAAGIYAVIIMGLFSVFTFIGYALWIRIGVSLIAVVLAIINIKDYFWFKEGVSLTIADEHKPKLYRNMRGILAPDKSTLALIGATAVMALGVTLIEMPCTAGLPILWTKLIAANNVGALMFVFLLGLYLLMYVLDELLVFVSAVVTLRAARLEERQGRVLKLVGGIVMLTLALVLLIEPTLMDSIANSMLVFGAAFAVAALVLFAHRKILPRFGVIIGTEER